MVDKINSLVAVARSRLFLSDGRCDVTDRSDVADSNIFNAKQLLRKEKKRNRRMTKTALPRRFTRRSRSVKRAGVCSLARASAADVVELHAVAAPATQIRDDILSDCHYILMECRCVHHRRTG